MPERGVRVKICGVTTAEAFDAVAEAGADWVGFNFFPPSPRAVSVATAAALSSRRADGPARVGLFVDPSDDELDAALAGVRLDVLQIYADAARVAAIRARTGRPVWRAVGVQARGDLPETPEPIDGYLVEAKAPADAARPGGNGASFDWRLVRTWRPDRPWLLAGGLRPDNVAAAIAASGAAAVDVSSGVETRPGVKDPALIRAFVAASRAALH